MSSFVSIGLLVSEKTIERLRTTDTMCYNESNVNIFCENKTIHQYYLLHYQ